ncbi:galanin receptor 2b-like [Ptychodera flava]|uniref:galanin receptor 2b-like n=1 Tax=Ptychodera flava TaxID=63121 RepID=UPI00396A2884
MMNNNTTLWNSTASPSNVTETLDVDGAVDGNIDAIMKVIFAIIGITGVVGNIIVIVVFARIHKATPTGLTSTNIFIVNQSCIDLVSSIFLLAVNLIPTGYIPHGIPGDVFCKLWVSSLYPMWACFLGSTLNLVFLTFERYFAICHPIKHHASFSQRKARIMVAVVWPTCFIYELHWAMVQESDNKGGCTQIWFRGLDVLGVIVFVFQYVTPIIIMTFAYISILRVVRRQSKIHTSDVRTISHPAQGQAPNAAAGQKNLSKTEKNIISTLLIVAVTYTICWSPNQIIYFWFNLGGYVNFNSIFFRYTVVSVCCNMCVNPFIYAAKLKEFREECRKILGLNRSQDNNQSITMSSNT